MSNNSASGGYLSPSTTNPLPSGQTFQQFLQTVFVGISGLPDVNVRPRWQKNPPKEPDVDTDWLAFGVTDVDSDTFSYNYRDNAGVNVTQRQEELPLQVALYGPNALDNATLLRDGFQIPQNLEALRAAKMGFGYSSRVSHVPDLVNELWRDRYEITIYLRRQVMRSYPILTFVSASGSIEAVVSGNLKTIPWVAPQGS